MNYKERYAELEQKIVNSYTEGVSMEDAEKLAGEFLHAMIVVAADLRSSDLDARMRKTGLKAIRANAYLAEVAKSDKKPSDTMLDNIVAVNETVQEEQNAYDKAEAKKEELERLYGVFKESHIHFRSIAKGGM